VWAGLGEVAAVDIGADRPVRRAVLLDAAGAGGGEAAAGADQQQHRQEHAA
jgi:hypothetical protein